MYHLLYFISSSGTCWSSVRPYDDCINFKGRNYYTYETSRSEIWFDES